MKHNRPDYDRIQELEANADITTQQIEELAHLNSNVDTALSTLKSETRANNVSEQAKGNAAPAAAAPTVDLEHVALEALKAKINSGLASLVPEKADFGVLSQLSGEINGLLGGLREESQISSQENGLKKVTKP